MITCRGRGVKKAMFRKIFNENDGICMDDAMG